MTGGLTLTSVQRAQYLVSYDISDDKKRTCISRYLLGFTVGRQKSVYECWFTQGELFAVQDWIEALLEDTDKVHIFKLPPSLTPLYYGRASRLEIAPIIIG